MAARRPGARLPVQHHEVLAAGAERGGGILARVLTQAERIPIERDRAVEVGDGEVHRAQAQRGGERGHGFMLADRRELKKSTSSAPDSSPSRPLSTCGRWLKRGSASTSMTLPAAPAFGSAAP